MTTQQIQTLKTELTTDPNGYGYAAIISGGNWQLVANAVNEVRSAISIPRPDVTPMEILEAINVQDFISNANVLYASWLESLTQFPSVRILKENGSDARVMTNIMKVLTNGSASETRIRALASRTGSRAEQLFGPGVSVSWEECQQAYNLP